MTPSKLDLKLIPITERLPEEDQDIIAWNGTRLVAAKYVMRNTVVRQDPLLVEMRGVYQTEKYPINGDRSLVTHWNDITHWMPAIL